MDRIEFYLDLKRGTLHEERKDLLTAIDRLIQEAQLFKRQIEAGQIYNPGLADRGRKVDERAIDVQNAMGTVAMLESLQKAGE
jgi:hypothetical protein